MRTLLLFSLFLVSNVLFAQRYGAFIKDLPKDRRVVNDYGSFLSSREESRLENELISYRKRSGNAIVIITLSTLPYSLEETALQYFNKWGIGDRKKDNGVLILLSKRPHGVRITTGSGIDHILTNDDCQRIIDEAIVPSFKAGNYYTGLSEGVDDIEAALGGTHNSVYSGGGVAGSRTAVADTSQTVPQAQAQPQPLTQNTPAYTRQRKPLTLGQAIVGSLGLLLTIWLRVRYVRSKRRDADSYSTESNNASSQKTNNVSDYLNATGWAFLMYLKMIWWIMVAVFGLFAILFGMNLFRRGGPLRKDGAASFGGGRSDGGGASGTW